MLPQVLAPALAGARRVRRAARPLLLLRPPGGQLASDRGRGRLGGHQVGTLSKEADSRYGHAQAGQCAGLLPTQEEGAMEVPVILPGPLQVS